MTCKIIVQDNVPTKEKRNNFRPKKGLRIKRKASSRTNRDNSSYRNRSRQEHNLSKASDNDSTHLVETEFRILQSLIPGISDQNEVSEVSSKVFLTGPDILSLVFSTSSFN